MARRAAGGLGPHGDDFSFVSPVVKYVLFFFNMLFWMISMVMVAVGVYARLLKHAEAAMACLAVDPAILLVVVGVLTFLITFCGCVGSLRENICLLQTFSICLTIIFLLQLAAGVLGFVFSDKARGKVSEIINGAIVHYRDDLDLQNLIDFGQKEVWGGHRGVRISSVGQGRVGQAWGILGLALNPWGPPGCGCWMAPPGFDVCGDALEASAFIYTNGCIDKLVNWIHSNLFLLGGIALGLAVPQLVGILLAQILINQIRDQIKLQLYNQQHRADPWY